MSPSYAAIPTFNVSVVENRWFNDNLHGAGSIFNLLRTHARRLRLMSIGVRDTTSDYSSPLIHNISDGWKPSENWLAQASGAHWQQDHQAAGYAAWLPTNKWTFSGLNVTVASFMNRRVRKSYAPAWLPGEIRSDVSNCPLQRRISVELTDAPQ